MNGRLVLLPPGGSECAAGSAFIRSRVKHRSDNPPDWDRLNFSGGWVRVKAKLGLTTLLLFALGGSGVAAGLRSHPPHAAHSPAANPSRLTTLPEYPAAEAHKHIGETVRLTGLVDCIGNGRRHTDVQIGGCLPQCVLWIVVPNDAKGPALDSWKLIGLTIAVTGKIESSGGTPQITIRDTNQIEAQRSSSLNYLAAAREKENKGDFDGAIADLDRSIAQIHAPGAYADRARLKANKGDIAGAIRDYDELIDRSANTYALARAAQHDSRAKLKIKNGDFDGAIADSDAAIRLNPRAPWHYATRGEANEGKRDFAAAVRDYQLAIKTEPHNSAYKDMLRRAQAGVVQAGTGSSSAREDERPGDSGLSAAKAEYERGAQDEAARSRYVIKLADIYYQLLQNDWATGEKKALQDGDGVLEELAKYPAPANSDSQKLSQLLVGEWAATRHANPYVFRADGKWGRSGSQVDDNWQIKGNQYLARDATGKIDEGGTIILLNNDYFVYSDRNRNVTFYSRFQKALADSKRLKNHGDEPKTVAGKEEFEAAKAEYNQSSRPGNEAARLAYVVRLARMAGQLVGEYRRTGQRNDELHTAINSELQKHPAPKDVDSNRLRQLLVGRWESPRRIYVYRANGTCGSEGGPISGRWRIQGNQLIQGDLSGPIILVNQDYFIYAHGGSVFFHSRVKG